MHEPPAPPGDVPAGAGPPTASSLPWMGLGLSTNLSPRGLPRPWRILERDPGAFDYVEYSAPLDPERARREAPLFGTLLERRGSVPVLFHPVHLNLWGPELEGREALEALQRHLRTVDAPWVSNDVGWWHAAGRFFPGHLYLPPPLTRRGVEDCAAHVAHVQAALDRPLAVENPAVIAVRGEMHVLDFMAALHARTGAPLLVDLGHLLSYQLARGLPADAGLEGFPLDAVIEIHIAGGVVSRRGGRALYVDDHPQPVREELFGLLEAVAPRCPRLRALTYEGDGHPDALARATLARLRRLLPRPAARVAPREPPERPPPSPARAPDARTAWRVFEETFAGAEPAEDAEGVRAEAEFRHAVLAEHLDRAFPLTRLLLAPDAAGLADFSASPEFRAGFEPPGRDPTESFARYARRRLREAPDEAASRALAFESFAAELAGRRRAPPAPGPGEIALAPGVAYGEFPVDLGELLHAAGSLRRHLAGRAEVSGRYDADALEALRQVALRAGPGPFPVAVRARGERVETLALPPELARLLAAAARGGASLRAAAPEPLRVARERGLVVAGGDAGA